MSADALIAVEGLRKGFPFTTGRGLRQRRGWLWAVDGVSFSLRPGETFGVVGESGCGKSTLAMLLLGLEAPSAGAIRYKGTEVARLDKGQQRAFRGAVQAVFQDPWSSLSPRQRIRDIVGEPLLVQGRLPAAERELRVRELMESVGLLVAQGDLFPHEFSGGQRQRICIARALSVDPELMVLDEPLSALDVSVQAQIINLLRAVQERTGMSYLFISHSLPAVRYLCDRVAVMYLGQVVELAPTARLFGARLHPYTRNLIAAARPLAPRTDGESVVDGEIPSPAAPPPGCRFHTRCSEALARCRTEPPQLREIEPGHHVRCHLYGT